MFEKEHQDRLRLQFVFLGSLCFSPVSYREKIRFLSFSKFYDSNFANPTFAWLKELSVTLISVIFFG